MVTPPQPAIVVSTMIVFCNLYSTTPLNSGAVSQMIIDAIREQLALRCYCTSVNSISSLTVAEDHATGKSAAISVFFTVFYTMFDVHNRFMLRRRIVIYTVQKMFIPMAYQSSRWT